MNHRARKTNTGSQIIGFDHFTFTPGPLILHNYPHKYESMGDFFYDGVKWHSNL